MSARHSVRCTTLVAGYSKNEINAREDKGMDGPTLSRHA